ncbi:MAG: hypothetical protein HYX99_02100, partial [Chloroflexi bacterium]|nr:hypothetical protein [Chloroflexota bacterium]
QIDDQYLDAQRPSEAAEAGRHSDPKTSGGYVDNRTADKKLPQYALPDNKASPPWWIMDSVKVAFDDTKYKPGDKVPGIIVAPFAGDRADITAKGVWKDGVWTLEWARKLTTGSQFDVQFSDLAKTYYFGLAVFDNAQVNHAWSSNVYKLIFAKAVDLPAFPPRIPANHAPRTECRVCHETGVGTAPKFPEVPNHQALKDTMTTCQACHKGP